MTIWHEGAVSGGPKNRKLLDAVAEPNLPREELTLGELFKRRDYFTAHVGKWHLGKAAFYPETQGFDVNIGGTYWGAPATFFFPFRGPWSQSDPELRYVPAGIGKPGDYLTDTLTDHALNIIRDQKDQRFFVNLWYHTVHTPIEGKPALVEQFESKPPGRHHRHGTYAAMIASLDENVGRVLELLDELGIADNTIVILTSDNGGVDFPSAKSDNRPPTNNDPLRSGKGTLYEGGIRVPLMIRWPGITQSGAVCEAMVSSQDFFPTLADGLGFDSEQSYASDGQSLMPVLRDANSAIERADLYWHYPHYYSRMTPASAVRQGDWKLIHYYEDDRLELFDLSMDLGESNNVAKKQPAKATELKSLLDAWRAEVEANPPRRNE